MAARPLADVDRPPAPGALLADVAAGASARPDRGGVAIRSLSRDRHAARPGMGGLAHPPDEHAAGRGAGHRAVVRHAPLVFRGRGQRRARAVCFYTIAHRAFLRRDYRWHRRTVHLSHRLPARALEKKSGAQANRADGAGAWWVAAGQAAHASGNAAGPGADAGTGVRKYFAAASGLELEANPRCARHRLAHPVGRVSVSRLSLIHI